MVVALGPGIFRPWYNFQAWAWVHNFQALEQALGISDFT
jgi:hypothetical protein